MSDDDKAVTQLARLALAFNEITERTVLRRLYQNPLIVSTRTFEQTKTEHPAIEEILDGMAREGYLVHEPDPMRARKRLREPIQPVNRASRRAGRKGDKRKGDTPEPRPWFGA